MDMLLKAGANPSAVGSVCISQENDKIMIMGPINYGRFLKSNKSCSFLLVTSLN